MEVYLPYQFSESIALEKAKKLLSRLAKKHEGLIINLMEEWDGNICLFRFEAKGKNISGRVFVAPGDVYFNAKLPFFFKVMTGKIESDLREEWEKLKNE